MVHEDYQAMVKPSPTLNSRIWFEEDCDWAVAWLDLLPVLTRRKNEIRGWYRDRFDELTDNAEQVIDTYFPGLWNS